MNITLGNNFGERKKERKKRKKHTEMMQEMKRHKYEIRLRRETIERKNERKKYSWCFEIRKRLQPIALNIRNATLVVGAHCCHLSHPSHSRLSVTQDLLQFTF